MLRVVFGVGNPGPEYDGTRHNLGFDVVDVLARAARRTPRKLKGLDAEGIGVRVDGVPVLLVKPLTYVNRCGPVLRRICDLERVPLDRVLVVVDDVNLPLGRVRLRLSGSDGGHNGLLSLTSFLETEAFPRLRIGIGKPRGGRLEDYVLGRFGEGERPAARHALRRAAQAVVVWAREGGERAMSRVNRRDLDPPHLRP